MNTTEELTDKIDAELTYSIDRKPVSYFPLIIRNVQKVSDTVISIPSGREDLIPEGYEVIDKRVTTKADIPNPKFKLRPNQQEAVNKLAFNNGLLNAKVGWGKTIAALAIAHKVGMKTLIITTTTTIRDMWVSEIEKWFGIEAGVIGSGKYNIEPPICVSNIQTLRNKHKELAGEFGLVICDEVHRCPAKTFTEVLNSIRSKYKIGLSGTLERKDGMHCVLRDYFGSIKFVADTENTVAPEVHLWNSAAEISSNHMIPWSQKMNMLSKNDNYRLEILKLAVMYASVGHKVLVVSDRVELLEWGYENSKNFSEIITGKVKERDEVFKSIASKEGKDILWATQSIFSEGVSLNELSCVILATPINNLPLLEQICGRVMRQAEGKLTPVVADIALMGNTGKRHRQARSKLYVSKGWVIRSMQNI
jgi:superfamily II DNA or RNA helicase